jgi:hypothetical protein
MQSMRPGFQTSLVYFCWLICPLDPDILRFAENDIVRRFQGFGLFFKLGLRNVLQCENYAGSR